MHSTSARLRVLSIPGLTIVSGLVLGLWAYWPTLAAIASKWDTSPHYSHGYLVPLFAIAMLCLRRQKLEEVVWQPNPWGLVLLAGGCALRLAGAFFYFDWFDAVSLLPCLAGLCVLAGGWKALAWAWPAIAFLFFMLPLPHKAEAAFSQPLRDVATRCTTYLLQLIGYPALAQGNLIRIGTGQPLNVAEACSGLNMLLVFVALSVAVAILVQRPLLDRLLLVASAVPTAIIANVVRVTTTGVLQKKVGPDFANWFHDSLWAALLMMAVGLSILLLEAWLLARVLIPREDAKPGGIFRFGRKSAPQEQPAGSSKIPGKAKTRVPSPLKLRRRL